MYLRALLLLCMVVVSSAAPLAGEAAAEAQRSPAYSPEHIIDSGHRFFGTVSRDFAMAVRSATKRWGTPNAYILGEEASGAFVGGLRYGEGLLYTQNGRPQKVYWQGPSIGFDWGGDGARTMMLVYDLRGPQSIYRRFAGVNGSAYLIGGFGITALTNGGITVVPIRSGVGARFGANIGYLKFTPKATWNPF